jgi:hypothetical protein
LRRPSARREIVNDAVCVVEEARIRNLRKLAVRAIVAELIRLVGFLALVGFWAGKAKLTNRRLRERDAQVLDDTRRILSDMALDKTISGLNREIF